MIKIQMATVVTNTHPYGVAAEHIWLENAGMEWPISKDEEKGIVRLEVFGPELGNVVVLRVNGGVSQSIDGTVVLRTFYMSEAQYLAAQMRTVYGKPDEPTAVNPVPQVTAMNKTVPTFRSMATEMVQSACPVCRGMGGEFITTDVEEFRKHMEAGQHGPLRA